MYCPIKSEGIHQDVAWLVSLGLVPIPAREHIIRHWSESLGALLLDNHVSKLPMNQKQVIL